MWRGCAIIAYGASSFFIYALTSCYYGSVETWGWTKCNALRRQMQSFAWADAKLCVGRCNALRWQMQCFALADAKLWVDGCNALREIGNVGTQKSLVLFWISEKGGKTHHTDC